MQNSGTNLSFKLIISMDDSLAHDVVPFVDQFLPVFTNPLLAIQVNQFRYPDAQDFKLFWGTRYVLGSQELIYDIKL